MLDRAVSFYIRHSCIYTQFPNADPFLAANSFHPAPKLDSAILRIDIYDQPLIPNERLKTFFKLIKAGFGQNREPLRNSLSAGLHVKPQEAEVLLASAGMGFMRRVETLSIEEWKGVVEKVEEEEQEGRRMRSRANRN